jgi:hypothetical protein
VLGMLKHGADDAIFASIGWHNARWSTHGNDFRDPAHRDHFRIT